MKVRRKRRGGMKKKELDLDCVTWVVSVSVRTAGILWGSGMVLYAAKDGSLVILSNFFSFFFLRTKLSCCSSTSSKQHTLGIASVQPSCVCRFMSGRTFFDSCKGKRPNPFRWSYLDSIWSAHLPPAYLCIWYHKPSNFCLMVQGTVNPKIKYA